MRSAIVKRSIVIGGHKTSVSLEDDFWEALKDIARERKATVSNLVGTIDSQRSLGNLSSAIRMFVVHRYSSARANPAGRSGGGAPTGAAARERTMPLAGHGA